MLFRSTSTELNQFYSHKDGSYCLSVLFTWTAPFQPRKELFSVSTARKEYAILKHDEHLFELIMTDIPEKNFKDVIKYYTKLMTDTTGFCTFIKIGYCNHLLKELTFKNGISLEGNIRFHIRRSKDYEAIMVGDNFRYNMRYCQYKNLLKDPKLYLNKSKNNKQHLGYGSRDHAPLF